MESLAWTLGSYTLSDGPTYNMGENRKNSATEQHLTNSYLVLLTILPRQQRVHDLSRNIGNKSQNAIRVWRFSTKAHLEKMGI